MTLMRSGLKARHVIAFTGNACPTLKMSGMQNWNISLIREGTFARDESTTMLRNLRFRFSVYYKNFPNTRREIPKKRALLIFPWNGRSLLFFSFYLAKGLQNFPLNFSFLIKENVFFFRNFSKMLKIWDFSKIFNFFKSLINNYNLIFLS